MAMYRSRVTNTKPETVDTGMTSAVYKNPGPNSHDLPHILVFGDS